MKAWNVVRLEHWSVLICLATEREIDGTMQERLIEFCMITPRVSGPFSAGGDLNIAELHRRPITELPSTLAMRRTGMMILPPPLPLKTNP
jgi:hypothetical protein